MIRKIYFIFILITALTAHAQEQISDSPGGTESVELTPAGQVIMQLDYLYTSNAKEHTHELPQTLLQIGINKRVEVLLGWGGYILSESINNEWDPNEYSLGAKIYFFEENGVRPAMSAFTSVAMPVEPAHISGDNICPEIRLLFMHTLSDTLAVEYNLGIESDNGEITLFYTSALEKELSEKYTITLELIGYKNTESLYYGSTLSTELSYKLNNSGELHLQIGHEHTDSRNNQFCDLGISWPIFQ